MSVQAQRQAFPETFPVKSGATECALPQGRLSGQQPKRFSWYYSCTRTHIGLITSANRSELTFYYLFSIAPKENSQNNPKCTQNYWQAPSVTRKNGRQLRRGQGNDKTICPPPRQSAQFMSRAIKSSRDAHICRLSDRQTFFHSAHSGRRKMLSRAGTISKPGIIGDVGQPVRTGSPDHMP